MAKSGGLVKKFMAVAALALPLLAGCGESNFDIARKPQLIEDAVSQSLEVCDTKSNAGDISYEQRLRTVLKDVDSVAFDKLKDAGMIICLDHRLSDQKTGFFDSEILGIYYPNENTVTLWDNGKDPAKEWFYRRTSTDWSEENIENLAGSIVGTERAADMNVGGTYAQYCGKNCTQIRWKWWDASSFSKELKKNPDLNTPPVQLSRLRLELG